MRRPRPQLSRRDRSAPRRARTRWAARRGAGAAARGRSGRAPRRNPRRRPLAARGKALGLMILFTTAAERGYDPADLTFAIDLGSRIATAADNARLYRDAERAIGVRDDFLNVASHELRTPLTSLKLAAQSLQLFADEGALAGAPPKVAQGMAQLIQRIERQSRRLGALAGALLDVSRLST